MPLIYDTITLLIMKVGIVMAKIITKDSKPGKGIEKDAPEKRRFFLFFEIFFDKFFKLVQLNFVYFVCLIPLFMGMYYSAVINPLIEGWGDILKYNIIVFTPTKLGTCLLIASVFITGPATAGFTYVIRNMQRREHTWGISDFFKYFGKNYKQGIIVSIMDMVCYIILYIAIVFYMFIVPEDAPEAGVIMPALGCVFVIAITLVFTWAHYYIYTMMVTFKLDFAKLFKNSIIFAIAKLPLNLMITAILGLTAYLLICSISITPLIAGILVPVIALSFAGFVIIFSTYPTIDKTMLQKVNKRVLNTRG